MSPRPGFWDGAGGLSPGLLAGSPVMGLGEDVAYVGILLGSIGLGPVVRALPLHRRK